MATDIIKYEFKPGLPVEFEVLQLHDLYKKHKDLITAPHRTGFYHILWFRKGKPTHFVDFAPVSIQPNTILFLNKDNVQRFDPKEHFDGIAILFTDNFYCRTEADTKFLRSSSLFNDMLAVPTIKPDNSTGLFASLVQQMNVEIQNKKDQYQSAILQNHLHNFLMLAEREIQKQYASKTKQGPDLDYVILFRDLLEKHFKIEKHVQFYAGEMMITEKRLNQATAKLLGKTPKHMIDERVLLEAKRLLAYTKETIKEIGFVLGFEEPTNFIKYFRKHSQLTPVEFREKNTAE
jgi:AraC family transcriptional regulator, transcriptional activator of pobA